MEKLYNKTILIGKDPLQGRLLISVMGKKVAIGPANGVPGSVSRCKPDEGVAHAKITVDERGNMILTNMRPQNVTYVNGSEIVSKRIVPTNIIDLGRDRYNVNLTVVLEAAKKLVDIASGSSGNQANSRNATQKTYSISHLRNVWESYENEMDRIAQEQQEMGKKRMLPIMIGSLSGVASPILATLVAANTLFITVPVAAISFGLYFVNYRKKDTSYEERKAAQERFTDDYVCPNPDCGKFLGNISYKLLKKQYSMQCPYCRSKFIEE